MPIKYITMNAISLLILLNFYSCKKDKAADSTIKKYTALTQQIVDSSTVIVNVFSDTSFQVCPGVEETDINYYNKKGLSTSAFILKVDLKNPAVDLRAATPFDLGTLGTLQTVTAMAGYVDGPNKRVMAGLNGDFYNTTTNIPQGIVYKNGVAVKPAYSDNTDKPQQGLSFFAILKNGAPFIGDRETDYPAMKTQLKEALGGGVFLVKDYALMPQSIPTVTARTCIGFTSDNVVYFVEVDGGNFYYSNGINYQELGEMIKALGVKDAINIDGGGSSTLMIKHPLANVWQVRNKPQDGDPRAIATSWLIIDKSKP